MITECNVAIQGFKYFQKGRTVRFRYNIQRCDLTFVSSKSNYDTNITITVVTNQV